jgi:hypothetical protein
MGRFLALCGMVVAARMRYLGGVRSALFGVFELRFCYFAKDVNLHLRIIVQNRNLW